MNTEKTKGGDDKMSQDAAKAMLSDNDTPKNIYQGTTSGVSNVLMGAVGGVGVLVAAPTIGLVAGSKQAGIAGGAIGGTVGLVVGVVGAPIVAIAGKGKKWFDVYIDVSFSHHML